MTKAPRRPTRFRNALARGARLAMCLWLTGAAAAQATPPNIILSATYAEPTPRYAHGVLGDAIEWGALRMRVDFCTGCENSDIRDITFRLPQNRVFEDIAPRLVDLEGYGPAAVMVVESDLARGARLALYHEGGLLAATPFIGRANRWLAPVGSADLDGDGTTELVYVDRPHLARTLRIWRYSDGDLREIATAEGYSNHRIGWDYIAGGIRTCAGPPEIIVASGDWQRIEALRFDGDRLTGTRLGAYSPEAMRAAMACR